MSITKKPPQSILSFGGRSAIQDAKAHAKPADVQASLREIEVDPHLCRMNEFHRRGPEDLEPAEVDSLAKSISAMGQRTPATGYELQSPDADGVRYVLITGCRRREAAIKAGTQLRVRLHSSQPTTKQIVEEMWSENSERRDYAPYYAALEMRQYIESGAFANAKAISTRFGIEETKVKRLLQVSSIPASVMDAYTNPSSIPMASLLKLARHHHDYPDEVLSEAKVIVSEGRLKDATARLITVGLEKTPVTPPDVFEHKAPNGHRLLHVRGLTSAEMTITVSTRSPSHKRLLAILQAEYPDLPK